MLSLIGQTLIPTLIFAKRDWLAERRGSGLQTRLHRFKSGTGLNYGESMNRNLNILAMYYVAVIAIGVVALIGEVIR